LKKVSLNIDDLIIFKEVVNRGSLMNASKYLGIPFSSVNYHITKIEKYFKTKLIDRTAAGIKINENGKKVYAITLKILDLIDETYKVIYKRKNNIKIEMGEIPSLIFFDKFLDRFQKSHPTMKIEIKSTSFDNCIKDLNSGIVDVAIVGEACGNSKTNIEEFKNNQINEKLSICSDEFILITPLNHPLSNKKMCHINEILKYKIIFLPYKYGIEKDIRNILKEQNVLIRKKIKKIIAENLHQQINMVISGYGIAITSKSVGLTLEKLGLVHTISVNEINIKRNIYVIFSRYFKDDDLKNEIINILSQLCESQ